MADNNDNMPLDDAYIISQLASHPDLLNESLDPSIFDRRFSMTMQPQPSAHRPSLSHPTANASIATYPVPMQPPMYPFLGLPKAFAPMPAAKSTSPSSAFDFGFGLAKDQPPFSTLLNNLASSDTGNFQDMKPRGPDRFTDDSLLGLARRMSLGAAVSAIAPAPAPIDSSNNQPRGLDRFTDSALLGLARRMSQVGSAPMMPWMSPPEGSIIKAMEDASAASSPSPQPKDDGLRFKPFHEEKWMAKYKELRAYRKIYGDCNVPYGYENKELARWVKRQRRQYKLLRDGKTSAMTEERVELLEEVGFVWDSHEAVWEERFRELVQYKNEYGDTAVPSNWAENKQLSTWVKCQRRLYKLYWAGQSTAMTPERFAKLDKLGFEWQLRSSSRGKQTPQQSITVKRNSRGGADEAADASASSSDEYGEMLFDSIAYL